VNTRRRAWVAGVALLLAVGGAWAASPPQEVSTTLPEVTLSGNSRFTYFGFDVYDASLWVTQDFSADAYERHPFALSLTYLRDFTGDAIATRSVDEMRRQPGSTDDQMAAWRRLMQQLFPNVRKGDRLTGIHRPGEGAVFLVNGRLLGTIRDAEFSRRFFGIWLSSQTSSPRLREALFANTARR